MDRRMETVKKQADTITDLESELSKARKQERAYEKAMKQLNWTSIIWSKRTPNLRRLILIPNARYVDEPIYHTGHLFLLWAAASGNPAAETENIPIEGNLETSHLLEQV